MPDPHLTSIISFSVLNNLMKQIKICPYLYDVSDLAQDHMGVESGRIKFFQSSKHWFYQYVRQRNRLCKEARWREYGDSLINFIIIYNLIFSAWNNLSAEHLLPIPTFLHRNVYLFFKTSTQMSPALRSFPRSHLPRPLGSHKICDFYYSLGHIIMCLFYYLLFY